MNTVNYITPSDGDIYLVNNQTYVNSGGTDFDKIYNNITVDDSLENILPEQQKSLELMRIFLKLLQRLNQDLTRMLYRIAEHRE